MTVSSSASSQPPDLTPDFWEGRYQEGTTRWDLGQAAPPFEHLLAQPDSPPPGRAIVLGCGRGHDALLFAQHGFEVVGVDFAPSAIAAATQAAEAQGLEAQFLQRDIFDLVPEYAHQFDYVIEHTCFCAIDPEWRDRYVELVSDLLRPQGHLIGLFFTHGRPGGPPYGIAPTAIRQYFTEAFWLTYLAPTPHSVESRRDEEHLGLLQKR